MIIAGAERGGGLLPLAQSIEAITQPKFTYQKKKKSYQALRTEAKQLPVSQPPPNINYYIFVWIKLSKATQMRGNGKGRGLIQSNPTTYYFYQPH